MIVLFVFVEIGQWVRRLVLFLVHQLERIAPPRVSGVVAVGLVVALTIALLNGVVVRAAMDCLNHTFAAVNDEDSPGHRGTDHSRCARAARSHWCRGHRSGTRVASSCRAARKSMT